MATCGYICPVCEGKTFLEDLSPCNYCQKPEIKIEPKNISDEEWIKEVHEGKCCSDTND